MMMEDQPKAEPALVTAAEIRSWNRLTYDDRHKRLLTTLGHYEGRQAVAEDAGLRAELEQAIDLRGRLIRAQVLAAEKHDTAIRAIAETGDLRAKLERLERTGGLCDKCGVDLKDSAHATIEALSIKLSQAVAEAVAEAAVMREALPPSEKMRLLADWFDLHDIQITRTGQTEVQDALRCWATASDAALSTGLAKRGKPLLVLIDAVNALLATSDDADYHRMRSKLVEARDNLACTPPAFNNEQPDEQPHE